MTDLREAAKMALKVLENKCHPDHEVIAALKRALQQPHVTKQVKSDYRDWDYQDLQDELADKQVFPHGSENCKECYSRGYVAGMDSQLFASDTSQERVDTSEEQRHEWVGLTKEEIEKCKFDSLNGTGWALDVDINLFYKSVEAKLKEKNR